MLRSFVPSLFQAPTPPGMACARLGATQQTMLGADGEEHPAGQGSPKDRAQSLEKQLAFILTLRPPGLWIKPLL